MIPLKDLIKFLNHVYSREDFSKPELGKPSDTTESIEAK